MVEVGEEGVGWVGAEEGWWVGGVVLVVVVVAVAWGPRVEERGVMEGWEGAREVVREVWEG